MAGAEPYTELRERATQQWGLQRTYGDFDKMLDAEELDAILVCTDNASKAYVMQLRNAEEYPALCDVVGVTVRERRLP